MAEDPALGKARRCRYVFSIALSLLLVLSPPAYAHHNEVVDKLERGITELVSLSSTGDQGDDDSGTGDGPACVKHKDWHYDSSDDGRLVTFASDAGNLHPADTNGSLIRDIFVLDRRTGTVELVSALPTGLASRPPSDVGRNLCEMAIDIQSHTPVISGNGRYIAFVSNLPLLGGPGPVNPIGETPVYQVFVRDLRAKTTDLVSVTYDGGPPVGVEGSGWAGISISDNGRFVAFSSDVHNVLPGVCTSEESNPGVPLLNEIGCPQSYVRDMKRGVTTLVSKSTAGEPAEWASRNPSISGNGRFVAFDSEAGNLVPGDVNVCRTPVSFGPTCRDVFIHDLNAQTTKLISVSRDGSPADDFSELHSVSSGGHRISDDGRFVLFRSFATNLVPVNNPYLHISAGYLRDTKTGRTERVSVSSTGSMLATGNQNATISDDGRYVLDSLSTIPVRDSGVSAQHALAGQMVLDRRTGQLDRVTRFTLPEPNENPDAVILHPIIGGDGSFVLGHNSNDEVLEEDDNGAADVFLRRIGTYPLGLGPDESSYRGETATADNTPTAVVQDRPDDALVAGMGAELLEARVTYRPELSDLFVRLDIDRLFGRPPLIGLNPYPVLYGVRFNAGPRTYEVRTQGYGGTVSSGGGVFGLFECSGAGCTEVAELRGGFGTVGEAIVVSVPLQHLDLEAEGFSVHDLEAWAGPGSYSIGVAQAWDTVGR